MAGLKFNIQIVALLLLFNNGVTGQNTYVDLNLLPWPEKIILGEGNFLIDKDFSLSINGDFDPRLYKAANRFLRRLDQRTGTFFNQGIISSTSFFDQGAPLKITVERPGEVFVGEDESYSINIDENSIQLNAVTDIGAIRGLETLLQLVDFDNAIFYFPEVVINDSPRFPWRGLMIDVARHYQPIDVLKRNLDAMAAVKMNVFHWHLSDDQGFRVEIKKHPKLCELGSDGLFYTQQQIKEIVAYAADRGITVIPEIDVPGHATAILAAYPELGSKEGSYKVERNAGIFDPTLNPVNPKTYELLDDIFAEMTPLFPDEYFHIGGDENEGKHWDENEAIQKFMKERGLHSNHDLQTYFNIKLQKILEKYGKKLMGWDEIMTPGIPTSALIHSWRGEHEGFPDKQSLVEASKNGYKVVLSNGYYIDRMNSVDSHYLVDPMPDIELSEAEKKNILGGEATMWGELVTPKTIDSRIWPRTAAIAERFWSAKEVNDLGSMHKRLKIVSFRLEELGITHLIYKDAVLRNITGGQDIESIKLLTGICEPLKGYTRNKGGTEYQTYSPFTLFADACTVDATDAITFKYLIDNYSKSKTVENKYQIVSALKKWVENHDSFAKLKMNPILTKLEPLSENLYKVSSILYSVLKGGVISMEDRTRFNSALAQLKKPYEDTEVVIVESLKMLAGEMELLD